jgi:hypothetical protein
LHRPARRFDRTGREASQSTPARQRRLALLASLGLLLAGAAGAGDEEDTGVEWGTREVQRAEQLESALTASQGVPLAPDTLQVRLAFDAAADLDLYVTDPMQETVYFGNTPARTGGRLEADRRCQDAAPRIETVVFAPAPTGRYRVGVDYPRPCTASEGGGDGDSAVFVLEVRHAGRLRRQLGVSAPLRFVPIVLEFDIEAAAGDESGQAFRTAPEPAAAPPR